MLCAEQAPFDLTPVAREPRSGDVHGSVVVAVPAVWMMQVPVDDEVDVVAVRNGGMAAACAVRVLSIVPSAGVARRASSGVHRVHLKGALVSVPVMGVM